MHRSTLLSLVFTVRRRLSAVAFAGGGTRAPRAIDDSVYETSLPRSLDSRSSLDPESRMSDLRAACDPE
jgi:hypothetical protein